MPHDARSPVAPDHTIEIDTNDITLSVRVAGSGPAVVLAHGFPETGYSWRHQVPALVAAGHRVIVPDMRGYGLSDRPDDVDSYCAENVGRDLIGLLDALGERDAAFVGHDWGAASVWPLALSHPERVRAVAGLSVPFGPPAPVPPTQIMRRRLGDDFYMLQFQEQGPPEEKLARDVRATMTATMASVPLTVDGTFEAADLPSWLTSEELAVYEQAFERSGFAGGLNYYRNIDRNWEHASALSRQSSDVPSMFLTGSLDPVRAFMPSDRMGEVFTRHRPEVILDGAGHWVQQERASEVNAALIEFLTSLDRP